MVRYGWADLDLSPAEIEAAYAILSPDERTRADRFVFEKHRRRFIAARARLRAVLGSFLGTDPRAIAFRYGAKGKPELAAPFEDRGLRFNLSHSEDRALVALAEGRELGADVEAVRAVRHGPAVARRFFSEEEQRGLAGLHGGAWDEAFFRCWTRKEAVIKAIGDGLSYPLRSFSTVGDAVGPWRLHDLDAGRGFQAALAVEGAGAWIESMALPGATSR